MVDQAELDSLSVRLADGTSDSETLDHELYKRKRMRAPPKGKGLDGEFFSQNSQRKSIGSRIHDRKSATPTLLGIFGNDVPHTSPKKE